MKLFYEVLFRYSERSKGFKGLNYEYTSKFTGKKKTVVFKMVIHQYCAGW